jgi:hypothetical protein
MADYNKQTVAQLRQLLKDRGIPSTGLTRKAQIIEKLEGVDAAGTEAPETSKATGTVAQGSEQAGDQSTEADAVAGPPLAEAGGMAKTSI